MTATDGYVDNRFEGEMRLLERKKSQRYITDAHHLFLFGMIFTLWFGIAIYAFSTAYELVNLMYKKSDEDKIFKEVSSKISDILAKCRYVCPLFIWLGTLLLGLYFIAVRLFTKYVVYATIVIILALLCSFVEMAIKDGNISNPIVIVILTGCFAFYFLTIYMFKNVGHQIVCTIIQDSCKAMFRHPSAIAIIFIKFILMSLISFFVALVILILVSIPKAIPEIKHQLSPSSDTNINYPNRFDFSSEQDLPLYILLFAFASSSLWIMTVIYNIGRTILYGIFSTWYRTVDKSLIPRTTAFRITYTIFRYHIGTITFGSTIFTFVQIIRTICNSWVDLYDKFKSKKLSIFCIFVVIANATSNTFVTSVNYGSGYYRSMRDSFKMLMQNPLNYAATRIVATWMILSGAFLVPFLTILFAGMYIFPHQRYYIDPTVPILIIAAVIVSITEILLETLYTSITTILFCSIEDLNSEENLNDYNDDVSIATIQL